MSCIASKASRLLEETTAKMMRAEEPRLVWAEFVAAAEKLISRAQSEWRDLRDLESRCFDAENQVDDLKRKLRDREYLDRVGDGLIPRICRGDLRLDDYCQARLAGIPIDRLEQLAGRR